MKRYVILCTFNIYGSGYSAIVENTSYVLHDLGNEVMILGIGYNKQPHNYPFHVVPIEMNWKVEALRVIPKEWKADRTIVAMDIPMLKDIADTFTKHDMQSELWGLEALFPVESDPIKKTWRLALSQYKQRYAISQYGTAVCNAWELPTKYFPIGCMVGNRPKDKAEIRRKLNWDENKTIFLTIASNQERKALPLGLQAFKSLPKGTAEYYIVTNPVSRIGWDLPDLIEEYGIQDDVHIIPSNLSRGELSMHYWAANALIVPSEAEGACLPIYEAASHGLPVICGYWTAMEDISEQDWVFTVDCAAGQPYRHAWGNVKRWIASVDDIHNRMEQITFMKDSPDYEELCNLAVEYAKGRSWKDAVHVLERGLDET